MKKMCRALLAVISLLTLTACGKSTADQWQEQYDLGQKYLLEEDYEAAIVAFTAAIEIDPNEAAAYVGRGDAYMMRAETDTQMMKESYENAAADYETALSLYAEEDDISEVTEKLSEGYLTLAEYYEAQGDDNMARIYYEKAYELTGDEEIAEKLETLGKAEMTEESEKAAIPLMDEESLVDEVSLIDENTIEYTAKYTTDLVYIYDNEVVGTANLYVCSEKEAILCVEALKNEDIDEEADFIYVDGENVNAYVPWYMWLDNNEYDEDINRLLGWEVAISWHYWNDGIYGQLTYNDFGNSICEVIYSSEESLTERNGKMYIQIKFEVPDNDTFEFYILENAESVAGQVDAVG